MIRRPRSFFGMWNIKTNSVALLSLLLLFVCKIFKSSLVLIKIIVVSKVSSE